MKLRKLTALGMAAVMTMSLAACGSSIQPTQKHQQQQQTQQQMQQLLQQQKQQLTQMQQLFLHMHLLN